MKSNFSPLNHVNSLQIYDCTMYDDDDGDGDGDDEYEDDDDGDDLVEAVVWFCGGIRSSTVVKSYEFGAKISIPCPLFSLTCFNTHGSFIPPLWCSRCANALRSSMF